MLGRFTVMNFVLCGFVLLCDLNTSWTWKRKNRQHFKTRGSAIYYLKAKGTRVFTHTHTKAAASLRLLIKMKISKWSTARLDHSDLFLIGAEGKQRLQEDGTYRSVWQREIWLECTQAEIMTRLPPGQARPPACTHDKPCVANDRVLGGWWHLKPHLTHHAIK